jgi:hypothetical protein
MAVSSKRGLREPAWAMDRTWYIDPLGDGEIKIVAQEKPGFLEKPGF